MTKRKQMRAETWIKPKVKPEEIVESPKDVLAHLMEDNENLRSLLFLCRHIFICKFLSKRKYFVLVMIVVLLKEVWRGQECP